VELPLATGVVHTVISSLASSFKIGAAVETVGTLWGDEYTGIYGVIGKAPAMIPLEVIVNDIRGKRTFNYEIVNERDLTSMLMTAGVLKGVLAHNDLPREHTLEYVIETEFEGLGAFRTANMTSQDSVYALTMDTMVPIASIMNTPFKKARVSRARVEVTVKQGARLARIDQVTLPKLIYKPGEKIDARVRWFHYRRQPTYTYETYSLTLPADLPDGKYKLTAGSMITHLRALRSEKPHLFYAENLNQVLQGLNRIVSFPENRLYMRLILPTKGLAIKQVEMPELPSFREQIFSQSKRTDVRNYTEAMVVQHETDFVVNGDKSFEIQVDRRADQ